MNTIRKATKEDIEGLKAVVDSSGLFPSEYLEGMMSDYLQNPDSEEFWLTSLQNSQPIGIAYCVPEKFTEGTYNLLAIGVLETLQGQGLGRALMQQVEAVLRERQARILIVETSGTKEFDLTRKFYLNLGYTHEATLRDFWSEGDDKVIFWKKLSFV
ncbi:MAG TPA: N-acetyltransferase [Cytophagales bacterium]|nr:N-acetyltransferase [Cytophagales bacterium]HAA21418.1 N-acetyltransferase [Cytophagales bacterium]HAP59078.1 N-acetyltransferase [Cytophagales bacterium]